MSHVLGVVIKAMDDKYRMLCQVKNVPADVTWVNRYGSAASSIRRYPWPDFDAYLTAITQALHQHGVTPLDFQRRLIPSLFSKLLSSRVVQRVFGPERLLRAIDVWAGPFMFRCGGSRVEAVAEGRYCLTITVSDDLTASPAFFDHCTAGVKAAFELMFPGSKVLAARVGERQLKIALDATKATVESRFEPTDSVVRDDLLLLIDDVINDLATQTFLSDLSLDEWHESVDHINRVANGMGQRSSLAVDQLTIVSSRVQMAACLSTAPDLASSHLAIAMVACRELRGQLLQCAVFASNVQSSTAKVE